MNRQAALAVARAFVDYLDRLYALNYLAWRTLPGQEKPSYQGIGSAERIEAAIDEALTVSA